MKNYLPQIILPLLILSVLIYQFRLSFYVIEYSIDESLFIEKYCVNKDKPSLECNGKCHLSKITKEDSKNNNPVNYLLDKEIIFDQVSSKDLSLFQFRKKSKTIYSLDKIFLSIYQSTTSPPPKSYFTFV